MHYKERNRSRHTFETAPIPIRRSKNRSPFWDISRHSQATQWTAVWLCRQVNLFSFRFVVGGTVRLIYRLPMYHWTYLARGELYNERDCRSVFIFNTWRGLRGFVFYHLYVVLLLLIVLRDCVLGVSCATAMNRTFSTNKYLQPEKSSY